MNSNVVQVLYSQLMNKRVCTPPPPNPKRVKSILRELKQAMGMGANIGVHINYVSYR